MCSGVQGAFLTLVTHYESLAFDTVSQMGVVMEYTEEELEGIQVATHPTVDILAEGSRRRCFPRKGKIS